MKQKFHGRENTKLRKLTEAVTKEVLPKFQINNLLKKFEPQTVSLQSAPYVIINLRRTKSFSALL